MGVYIFLVFECILAGDLSHKRHRPDYMDWGYLFLLPENPKRIP